MQKLFEQYIKSGDLHHAYYLVGETEKIVFELKQFIENKLEMAISGNPDFFHANYKTFSIDNAKFISESQERKDFTGSKKIFIIETDFITEEAQNSLLKVFEEPTVGTHFFVVSPQEILLPTLKSRMVTIVESQKSIKSIKTEEILGLKITERLARVKEIAEAINEAKTSSSNSFARSVEDRFREDATKQDAIFFLNQIESELYELGVEKTHKSLRICEETRASLYDRGAPVKMILENLVLNI